MVRMMQSRQASEKEQEKGGPLPPNRLTPGALSDCLNECKAAKTSSELDSVAKRYALNRDVLETLLRYVSPPTIEMKNVEAGKQITLASWIDSPASPVAIARK